jgi:hypothetical protein
MNARTLSALLDLAERLAAGGDTTAAALICQRLDPNGSWAPDAAAADGLDPPTPSELIAAVQRWRAQG